MLFSQASEYVQKPFTQAHISKDWAQGRASYGGLVAALVFRAMSTNIRDERPIRSLQITFAGPVAPGNLELQSEVIREGKSVTHILGKGLQNGEILVTVVGSFGVARDSNLAITPRPNMFEEKPEEGTKLPFIEGVIPTFTKHFDFRYCTPFPFTGSDQTSLRGFVKFTDGPKLIDEAHLLGLVDAWPPTVLPLLTKPSPASSLNWTIEFMQPLAKLSGAEYSQYQADIMLAKDGYGHTRATIWNQAGELMALSQQTVTYFAKTDSEPEKHIVLP